MTDYGQEFDKIPAGYAGPLYLEVSPRTFPIVARTRLAPVADPLPRTAMRCCRRAELHDAARRRDAGRLRDAEHLGRRHRAVDRPYRRRGPAWSAIAASTTPALVDVDKRAAHDVLDFWEPLYNHGARRTVLDPDEFYILVSREAVHVPPPMPPR